MGSTFVAVAESKAEVIETLNKDIYARSGVWDVEKVCRVTHPSLALPATFPT